MGKLFIYIMLMSYPIYTLSEDLILTTSLSPPYQFKEHGVLSGTSVNALSCIFKRINQPYQVKVVPWKRAQSDVQTGNAHGFFTAMPITEVEQYAIRSAPLALEKWYWYFKDKNLFKNRNYRNSIEVGAIRGSNQRKQSKHMVRGSIPSYYTES